MIVLSAIVNCASGCPHELRDFVQPKRHQQLLKRTVASLQRLGDLSPTFRVDLKILEMINVAMYGQGTK